MGLLWNDRNRSEGAYAPEKLHMLACSGCGYSRTERFADFHDYPLLLIKTHTGEWKFVENTGFNILKPRTDSTTIAGME